jgi:hypothetical protein
MYTGINSGGINREVVATLECTSLNKQNVKRSLAIPKTAILNMAKALEGNLLLGSRVEAADSEKIRGILPALRHMVDLDSQVLKSSNGVTFTHAPISSQDIENYPLDPFGNDYFCKLCHQELFNSFMHCNGCENLLGKDFNICIQCHQEGAFKSFHQMNLKSEEHVSTKNHTGNMVRGVGSNCRCSKNSKGSENGQVCSECSECPHCSCECHTLFTHYRRFYNEGDLKKILIALEGSVKGTEIKYSEETQVRLKLTADRNDAGGLEAKRSLLDKLRNHDKTQESASVQQEGWLQTKRPHLQLQSEGPTNVGSMVQDVEPALETELVGRPKRPRQVQEATMLD